jgi:hypothetical protein
MKSKDRKLAPMTLPSSIWEWLEFEAERTGEGYNGVVRRLILAARDADRKDRNSEFNQFLKQQEA